MREKLDAHLLLVAKSLLHFVRLGKITELADLFLGLKPDECSMLVNLRDQLGKTPIFYAVELNLKNITL